nr:stigma-specific STIG1-like protein 2 [Nicotiana tomentosiformis]
MINGSFSFQIYPVNKDHSTNTSQIVPLCKSFLYIYSFLLLQFPSKRFKIFHNCILFIQSQEAMKTYLKISFLLAMIMASTTILSVASSVDKEEEILLKDDNEAEMAELFDIPLNETDESSSSIRGASRFLSQKSPYYKSKTIQKRMTCNKNPRICRAKGSPGPFCCKKKCVNVFTDRQNCGFCGKKCRYNETCCKGQCVNTLFHKRNCGGCNNKCQKGSACVYGMCSYAN